MVALAAFAGIVLLLDLLF